MNLILLFFIMLVLFSIGVFMIVYPLMVLNGQLDDIDEQEKGIRRS